MKNEMIEKSTSRNKRKEIINNANSSSSTQVINEINTDVSTLPIEFRKRKSKWINIDNSDIFLNKQNSLNENRRNNSLTNSLIQTQDVRNNIYLTQNSPTSLIIRNSKEISNKLSPKKLANLSINQKHEGIKEYINKTNQLILMKFSLKMKEERMDRMKQSYTNELESLKESIKSIEITKRSFEEDFQIKYDKYFRFMKKQIQKENQKLDDLIEVNKALQKEVKALESKKNKNKEILERNKNFKYFLICVKERKISFIPKKEIELKDNSGLQGSKKNFYRLKFKKDKDFINNELVSLHKTNSFISLVASKIFNLNLTEKVYDKSTELVDDLNLIEHNNMLLLERYNSNNIQLARMLKDQESYNEFTKENEHINKQLEKKDKKLEKLKEKYNLNTNEKEKLLSNSTNKENVCLNFNADSKFTIKLINCYKLCFEFYSPRFQVLNQLNLNSIKELNSNIAIEILRFVEKNFEFLFENYKDFQMFSPLSLREYEKELDLERKKKSYQEQKAEIQKKTELLNKQILDRINRVNKLQGRRIVTKQPPLRKGEKKAKTINKKEQPEVFEFLQY